MDCILFRFSTVASPCSRGFVTEVSTSLGVAPGYVVITTTYGRSMLGIRSGVIPSRETTPSAIIITITTKTVIGFFTLYFGILIMSPLSVNMALIIAQIIL